MEINQNIKPAAQESPSYVEARMQEMRQKLSALYDAQEMSHHYFEIHLDDGNAHTPGQIHTHPFYEVLYCQSNCGAEFQVDTRQYQLQRGDILVIPPQTRHTSLLSSKTGDPYAGYTLWISDYYFEQLQKLFDYSAIYPNSRELLVRTRGTLWEQIDSLFRIAHEESYLKPFGWEAAFTAYSVLLITQISRAITSNPNTPSPAEKPELLDGILSYVEANLSEKITLDGIASRFFVSPSTITHLFNKKMGISFYKYVMQRRLAESKNLIFEGMPMEKIAARVGFSDYSAFYRAFKQEFGVSPRQYSKQTSSQHTL